MGKHIVITNHFGMATEEGQEAVRAAVAKACKACWDAGVPSAEEREAIRKELGFQVFRGLPEEERPAPAVKDAWLVTLIKELREIAETHGELLSAANGERVYGELAARCMVEDDPLYKATVDDPEVPEGETTPEPTPGTDGLEESTVADLEEIARSEDIDLGDATKKADIIAAIRKARKG